MRSTFVFRYFVVSIRMQSYTLHNINMSFIEIKKKQSEVYINFLARIKFTLIIFILGAVFFLHFIGTLSLLANSFCFHTVCWPTSNSNSKKKKTERKSIGYEVLSNSSQIIGFRMRQNITTTMLFSTQKYNHQSFSATFIPGIEDLSFFYWMTPNSMRKNDHNRKNAVINITNSDFFVAIQCQPLRSIVTIRQTICLFSSSITMNGIITKKSSNIHHCENCNV